MSDSIIYLLGLSKLGRIYVSAESDTSAEYERWLSEQRKETRESWRLMADWSERDQASFRIQSVLVVDGATDHWTSDPPQLCIRTASELAARTFEIILENQRNDRAFLLAFAGESKAVLEGLEASGAIRYAGAGGIGEMKALLRDQVSLRSDRRLKFFAVFDSDGERAGHRSSQAVAVALEAAKLEVAFHCLERRAIENYLPLPAVYDFVGTRPRSDQRRQLQRVADAFKLLTQEQKAHFPMKVGLPPSPNSAQLNLYADLKAGVRADLGAGFTENLSEMFGDVHAPKLSGQIEADRAKEEVRRAIQAILFLTRAPV